MIGTVDSPNLIGLDTDIKSLTLRDDMTAPQINNDTAIKFDEVFKELYLTPDRPDDYRHTGND